MWPILLPIVVTSYRASNIFIPKTAQKADVVKSMRDICERIPTNETSLRRKDIVTCDADDIVFDAIAGSRRGTVACEKARKCMKSWSIHDFESNLMISQMTVLLSQTIYVVFQLAALAVVTRVILDSLT